MRWPEAIVPSPDWGKVCGRWHMRCNKVISAQRPSTWHSRLREREFERHFHSTKMDRYALTERCALCVSMRSQANRNAFELSCNLYRSLYGVRPHLLLRLWIGYVIVACLCIVLSVGAGYFVNSDRP